MHLRAQRYIPITKFYNNPTRNLGQKAKKVSEHTCNMRKLSGLLNKYQEYCYYLVHIMFHLTQKIFAPNLCN